MGKDVVREQFGENAASYATNEPHAKGESLERLVELIDARPDWNVLDAATAAGHTAFAFAPLVSHVRATDITPEMIELAKKRAAELDIPNVTAEYADAEELPYKDGVFDLLTCRIAAHHFGDVEAFVRESVRVLKSGGILAVVDNIVPEGPAGDYVNAFEKLRDPSHVRCLGAEEWLGISRAHGLEILNHETLIKPMQFESWAARHDTETKRFLKAMLTETGGEAAKFLDPRFTEDGTVFNLRESIIISRVP